MAEVDRPLIAVASCAATGVGLAASRDNDFVGQKTIAVSFNFETRRLVGGGYVFDRSYRGLVGDSGTGFCLLYTSPSPRD